MGLAFSGRRSLAARTTRVTILVAAAVLSLGTAAAVLVIDRMALASARHVAGLSAESVSESVRAHLQRPAAIAATMHDAMLALWQAGVVSRETHNVIMRGTLQTNPDLLGTWVGWEPDAFDGMDATFTSTPQSDSSGRFIPYWHRSSGEISIAPLVDYQTPGPGDYYQLALKSGRPQLIEPYSYEIDGADVLMTTLSIPLIDQGVVKGVAGLDIALSDLQTALGAISPPFGGRVSLISQGGMMLRDGGGTALGLPAGETNAAAEARTIDDPVMGSVMRLERTVRLDGFESGWIVRLDLPMSQVMAGARSTQTVLVVTALAMLGAMALAMWMTVSRMVGRPLNSLSAEMRVLAAGDLAAPAPMNARSGELNRMQADIATFRAQAVERARLAAELEEQRDQADAERRMTETSRRAVIDALACGLARLAEGDLLQDIDQAFDADYESLRRDFNDAQARLRSSLGLVAETSDRLRGESNEINRVTDGLTRRAERQVSQLTQTANAVKRIAEAVEITAQGAIAAGETMIAARRSAENGGETISRTIRAMKDIDASSREIVEITSVIDDIAFQTNLLALNAGVEAARAGDAGRGFAIVAAEVRSLAQRSADAARKIKALIDKSAREVDAGVRLVAQSGETLDEITAHVSGVSGIVDDISGRVRQQVLHLSDVNNAVSDMDKTTRQTTIIAQHGLAAAQALADDANALASLLDGFQIEAARFGWDELNLPRSRAAG